MAVPSTDTNELARFGYKQELDRSLGLFSCSAAGLSHIPIMTGVFELFFGYLVFPLRLDHQVEQLRRGQAPDDFIDPRQLNPLAWSYLRQAFRAVASVQARLAGEPSLGGRWG